MDEPEEAMAGPSDLCGVAPEAAYGLLQSSRKGLSADEAARRLEAFGDNVLTAKKPIPMWRRFGAHLVNMFAILLWVASALSFASDQAALGFAIILVILLNAVFAFVQEFRAEKAIEALRNMLPPKAKVVRDGQMQEIEAKTLVPGDLLVVEEGDLISADARLVYAADLRVDNSALTGEVDPVMRRADVLCTDPPSITDVESFIFTGSTAVLGQGRAVVYATGMSTEFGKIAGLTQSVADRLSPLQKNIERLSKLISLIAVVLGVFFFILGKVFVGMDWLAAAVFAIGIIVANVPEGLLPTLTMALSVAAQRMAKRNVLVKKLSSVETLGSTTVICTDKTGTLTANQMTVREVWLPGVAVEVDGVGYAPVGSFSAHGKPVAGLSLSERARIRNHEIGFIFQSFNLIGDLTVYENVELPLVYRGLPLGERRTRVLEALEEVGMSHRAKQSANDGIRGEPRQMIKTARHPHLAGNARFRAEKSAGQRTAHAGAVDARDKTGGESRQRGADHLPVHVCCGVSSGTEAGSLRRQMIVTTMVPISIAANIAMSQIQGLSLSNCNM